MTPVTPTPAPWRLLLLSLLMIFGGGLACHLLQSDGGRVEVTGFRLDTVNGQWVTADLFHPTAASREHPAPVVLICPGFERSKETMASFSMELARRGFVVITIDPYNQGASSSTMERRSATKEGYGLVAMAEYVHGKNGPDFIDRSRVGAFGYSAGGNAVLQTASQFGSRQATALRRATRLDSEKGRTVTDNEIATARRENLLTAIFVGGYVLTMNEEVFAPLDANVGMDYARSDEGAFRNLAGSADMRTATESLALVNSARPAENKLKTIEIGSAYGDADARTYRIVHNTPGIHPLLPYDDRFVAHVLDFFDRTLQAQSPLPPEDQRWKLREAATATSLFGGLLFLIPCAGLLLRLPLFASVRQPTPPALPAPTPAGRKLAWCLFFFGALVAAGLFMPLAKATLTVFPEASSVKQTWWFPQRINNALLLWALANGTIALTLFWGAYRLYGRHHGVTPAMWGLKITAQAAGLTALLAFTVVGCFYALLFTCYSLFHADFRCLFVAASTAFPSKMLIVALEYIPLFFVFYFANSLRVIGGTRREGVPAWRSGLYNAFGNTLGLILVLSLQYLHLGATEQPFWTDGWLYVNLLFGVIPMMFLLPWLHRIFFELSGQTWLGPLITCPLFVIMMLTSNVCYIPLK